MNKLTFIIPAHKYIEDIESAIMSVNIQAKEKETYIYPTVVGPMDVVDKIKSKNFLRCIVPEDYDTSYASMVNFAILELLETDKDAEWISILEYDDELLPGFVETFDRYSKVHTADIYSLMSLNLKSGDNNVLLGSNNEVAWAGGMAEKQGWYDYNLAIRGHFSFINSMVINIKCFKEFGYFKPSMAMYDDYEWFLRMIYNDAKVFAIPQIRHYHYVRDDSKSMHIANNISKTEREFWLSTARKEYFFDEDREIAFEDED